MDLGAVRHNVRVLKDLVAPGSGPESSGVARMMVVVKADAYGHGMVPVAAAARRELVLGTTWSRLWLPLPFARVVVAYAEPTWVEGEGAREAAAQVERFAALQREAVARAYAAAGRPAPDE